MIKAENLRIGDLVRVCRNCWYPEGSVCIVTQLNTELTYNEKKGVATLSRINCTDDDGPWGIWCNYIEGIPLSPAILEKMGLIPKSHENATSSILVVRQDAFADISISNAHISDG